MGAMVTGIMRTSTGFVQEREQGVYRRLALTPLKRQTLIGSQLLQHYIVIIVQTLLLIAIGAIAFKTKLTGNHVPVLAGAVNRSFMLYEYRVCPQRSD